MNGSSHEVTLRVTDMTCTQCERTVERALCALGGVGSVRADYRTGEVMVTLDRRVPSTTLRRRVAQAGYTPEDGRGSERWATPLVVALALIAALVIDRLGLQQSLQSFPVASAGAGVVGYALVGLLTSTHCVAMCGGLVLLGSVGGTGGARTDGVAPYQLGRLASYTLVGGLLGALGQAVQLGPGVRVAVGIGVSVVMLLVGLTLVGDVGIARRLVPLLPEAPRAAFVRASQGRPLLVGLANGLMPCGPLQAMQLVAVASGSAARGALYLAAFCLGTMPLMAGMGIVAKRLSAPGRHTMRVAGGAMVMCLGTLALANNLALAGVRLPFGGAGTGLVGTYAQDGTKQQLVRSRLEPDGYPDLTVRAGVPVRWELEASEDDLNGCNNTLVMPEWDVRAELLEGTNVIEFTPTAPGEYVYSCWMGMIRATVRVT